MLSDVLLTQLNKLQIIIKFERGFYRREANRREVFKLTTPAAGVGYRWRPTPDFNPRPHSLPHPAPPPDDRFLHRTEPHLAPTSLHLSTKLPPISSEAENGWQPLLEASAPNLKRFLFGVRGAHGPALRPRSPQLGVRSAHGPASRSRSFQLGVRSNTAQPRSRSPQLAAYGPG